MAELKADTVALQQLVAAMQQLTEHCELLQQGASGFAQILPAEWRGPAMVAFQGIFESWAASAGQLKDGASTLHDIAENAHTNYTSAIEALDTSWTNFNSQLES